MSFNNNPTPRRTQVGPEETRDLWRSILHGWNIGANCRITAFEMKSIIDLAEPALQQADRLGLAAGENGFWFFKGWLRLVDDSGLSAISNAVAGIKKRLDRLISKGDIGAIDDHVWVAALAAECREETWRRIQLAGSPIFGEGRRLDTMKVHSAIGAAHRAWHENAAADNGVRA